MDARKRTAELPGGPLAYRETGAGDAIVFLHGLAGNSLSWVGQFERFSRDHRCIAWDAPGYSGSALVEPDADRFAEALAQLFDHCGPREYGLERARNMLSPDAPADVFDLIAEIASRASRDGVEAAARMINETDNRDLLAALACPVSVFSGEVDPVVAKERTDELSAAIPGARSVIIVGAGHAPYLEKPGEFNAALGTFLTREAA